MAGYQFENAILIESQYFPNIFYYKTLINSDILLIERYEHYQKMSFRNRCYVAGPNGRILLSVPLTHGKNQRTVVKDVKISYDEKWQDLHFKTLLSAYRRSPWFEYFEDQLAALFSQKFTYLLDWNMACFEWVNKRINVTTPVSLTESYRGASELEAGITDMRGTLLPANMESYGEQLPGYTQVFGERTGFLPNLSILDLLFNEGKNCLAHLK